jgi:hypothetical protein
VRWVLSMLDTKWAVGSCLSLSLRASVDGDHDKAEIGAGDANVNDGGDARPEAGADGIVELVYVCEDGGGFRPLGPPGPRGLKASK